MQNGRTSAALRHLTLGHLKETLRGLERAEGFRAKTGQAALPFGIAALDSLWPEGGLPRGALHEIAGASADAGGFAAATAFTASIAGRLGAGRPNAPVLWCARGHELYGPGLAGVGLAAQRLIVAEARNDKDLLAAMEEGLRAGVLAAVVGEVERIDLTASRRLQLAAEKTGCTALVLRRPGKRATPAPITAASRWRVGPAPGSGAQDFYQIPAARPWRLELIRARCGAHGSWIVEAPDAQGHLRLPALLADRSLGAPVWQNVA
ncbi:MAG: damage-inducible mutagenesis protein [Rhodospirillaceae bacterium]|nr:damage-inducible mutagenesis protein [Rhodospirillaceae bacterium]